MATVIVNREITYTFHLSLSLSLSFTFLNDGFFFFFLCIFYSILHIFLLEFDFGEGLGVIASDFRCGRGRYFSNYGGHSSRSTDSSRWLTSAATEEAVVLT